MELSQLVGRPIEDTPGGPNQTHSVNHRILGTFLAFILVFLVWDTWDALLDYIIVGREHGKWVRPLANVFLVGGSAVFLKYAASRRSSAIASMLLAVGAWDVLEFVVAQVVAPGHEAFLLFYSISLLIAICVIGFYERRYQYDIISNHLSCIS